MKRLISQMKRKNTRSVCFETYNNGLIKKLVDYELPSDSLLSDMLKVSQNTPLDRVNEEMLNAWDRVIEIANVERRELNMRYLQCVG